MASLKKGLAEIKGNTKHTIKVGETNHFLKLVEDEAILDKELSDTYELMIKHKLPLDRETSSRLKLFS